MNVREPPAPLYVTPREMIMRHEQEEKAHGRGQAHRSTPQQDAAVATQASDPGQATGHQGAAAAVKTIEVTVRFTLGTKREPYQFAEQLAEYLHDTYGVFVAASAREVKEEEAE